MFCWKIVADKKTTAKPAVIWKIFTDFEHMSKYMPTVESCKLEGPLAVGTKGIMKIKKDGMVCPFVITDLEKEKLYKDKTSFFGTNLRLTHKLANIDGMTQITHIFQVSGVLAPLMYFTMRKHMKKVVKDAVDNLASMAESNA